ncbi:MAG: sensor histidine kinase [Bacteroidetes bacterium]|nr:sensor histidine kinase [Bacteroidota bacterium]
MKNFIFIFIFLYSICLSKASNNSLEGQLYIGKYLIKNSRLDDALSIYQNGLEQAKIEKNILYLGKYYLETADLLLLLNRVDSLDSYYSKANNIFEKLGMKPEIIRSQTGMLEVSRRINPSSTMDKYINLLKQARAIKNNDVYYNVLEKIILVNNGMENYTEAFAQTHECINYYKSIKDTLRLATKYRELGALFFTHLLSRTGEPYEKDSCIFYNQLAIQLSYKIKSFRNLVFAFQRLSWLLYKSDLKTAWKYIQIADSIDKLYNIQSPQLPNIMSFSLFQMGKVKEAIDKSKESLRMGLKAKQLFIGIQAADQLCIYYKAINETDSALHYKEYSVIINDSIRSQRQYKDAVKMQAKLEFDRTLFEKEIIQQEEMKRQKLINYSALLGVILLIIIVVLVYKAYIDNKKTTAIISQQNDEKDILLKEIHHRVKNNLSVISSILELQQREIKDDNLKSVFKDAQLRVNSMALVHRSLYEQDFLGTLNASVYFNNLYSTIYDTYKNTECRVSHEIVTNNIELNLDTIVPLALIVNELLTNSFKYAFAGRSNGRIYLGLQRDIEYYVLIYKDNGIGIEKNNTKRGLGSVLINGLTKQLKGNIKLKENAVGVEYTIHFKLISLDNGSI